MDKDRFDRLFKRAVGFLEHLDRQSPSDDLAQEAVIRLHRYYADRPEEEQDKLLFECCRSALIDHLRKQTRRREAEWLVASACEPEVDPRQEDPLELEEDIRRFRAGIVELDRDQQLVWVFYVAGFAPERIAEALGKTVNAVNALKRRAKEKLAERLGGSQEQDS